MELFEFESDWYSFSGMAVFIRNIFPYVKTAVPANFTFEI